MRDSRYTGSAVRSASKLSVILRFRHTIEESAGIVLVAISQQSGVVSDDSIDIRVSELSA